MTHTDDRASHPVQERRLEDLSRDECLHLLQYQSFVGRLGFVVDGRPVVLPVNYLADETSVVFCTASGSILAALGDGVQVAFEVDQVRPLYHQGWSVLVQGTAHEITDEQELELLRRGPLRSWVTASSEHWVEVRIETVSGRSVPGF